MVVCIVCVATVKEGGVAVETGGPSSSPASHSASDSGSSDDATVGSEPDFFDGGLDALLERSDALPHVTFKSVAAAETGPWVGSPSSIRHSKPASRAPQRRFSQDRCSEYR